MTTVVRLLRQLSDNPAAFGSARGVLQQAQPLLQQYTHLLQYLLTSHVASFRTSAKLLSVLQGVFSELAEKVRVFIEASVISRLCVNVLRHDDCDVTSAVCL